MLVFFFLLPPSLCIIFVFIFCLSKESSMPSKMVQGEIEASF